MSVMPSVNLDISGGKKKRITSPFGKCQVSRQPPRQGEGTWPRWPCPAVPVGLYLQNWGTLGNQQPHLMQLLTAFSSALFHILLPCSSSPFPGVRQGHGQMWPRPVWGPEPSQSSGTLPGSGARIQTLFQGREWKGCMGT